VTSMASTEGPAACFGVSVEEPTTADTIQFFDASHDPADVGIAWRAWDFGDGATGVGSSPVHRYSESGQFEVTLTLATFDGRVGSSRQVVEVRAQLARD
jgi:PKD repeat protein